MSTMKTAKTKTTAPSAVLAPEATISARPGGRYDDILALQRAAGNDAVNQLLQQRGARNPLRKAIPSIVHDVLNRDPGKPLDATTRAFFEARFGHDFNRVRVHTSTYAAESAAALNAIAYTAGRDVVFGAGQYAPGRSEAQELLAHELTHVVQQEGRADALRGPIEEAGYVLENEADRIADVALSRQPLVVVQKSQHGAVQCKRRRGRRPVVGSRHKTRGIKEIEGTKIFVSRQELVDRLTLEEGNINVQIQSWTEDGVGDLRDGLQEAALSFQNWYGSQKRRPNTGAFISNLVWAIAGTLSAVFTPGSAAAVIAGVVGGLGGVASTLLGVIDPNAGSDEKVRQLVQGVIRESSIIDRNFNDFGRHLKKMNRVLWDQIGIGITSKPQNLLEAQNVLYDEAGVPRPNQPYGEVFLTKLIYEYTDWTRSEEVRQMGPFFVSPDALEYAFFTEKVRKRIRAKSAEEAQRRPGETESR